MYDTAQPILIRIATTYHPSGAWSGYIWALYEPLTSAPRELFFETTQAALLFAGRSRWVASLDARMIPAKLAASEYIMPQGYDDLLASFNRRRNDSKGASA